MDTVDSDIDDSASDRALVAATVAGSAEALAVLHRRHYTRLYRLALVRCRNVQDAEDIASDTFVRAIPYLSGYRFEGDSLFPYLARIASNLIADQGRRRRGMTLVSLDSGGAADALRSFIEALPAEACDPHQLAERHEVRATMYAAISSLPADQADAVLLRYGADLPLKEIALALHKTEGAIKSLLHRALANLRRSLAGDANAASVAGSATTLDTASEISRTAVAKRGGWG
jgi:RNA polymerase sigma-70 factor (ECF subfamily)